MRYLMMTIVIYVTNIVAAILILTEMYNAWYYNTWWANINFTGNDLDTVIRNYSIAAVLIAISHVASIIRCHMYVNRMFDEHITLIE